MYVHSFTLNQVANEYLGNNPAEVQTALHRSQLWCDHRISFLHYDL